MNLPLYFTVFRLRRNREFGILQIVFISLVILIALTPVDAADILKVHFLDVGYADSILVEQPDNTFILVDAADPEDAPVIIGYLDSLKVAELSALIITHPHKNHFGAALEIAGRITIGKVFINGNERGEEGYQELLDYFLRAGIPVSVLRKGETLPGVSPGLSWEILHPSELSGDVNGDSIVSLVTFQNSAILLTADITAQIQDDLVEDYPGLKKVQCVQLSHHGRVVGKKFAKNFRDLVFVMSTGENPWGLPSSDDLARLTGPVFSTETHGTVIVESDGKGIKVSTEKDAGH